MPRRFWPERRRAHADRSALAGGVRARGGLPDRQPARRAV